MVAVVVLVILLGIVSMIYKSSADAVSHTNSTVSAIDKLDAFRRQVEDDLRHVCRDGYMILVRREFNDLTEATPDGQVKFDGIDGVRADKLIFWRTGAALRAGKSDVLSNIGMVMYGHADFNPATASGYGQTPADGTAVNPVHVNRWAVGRRVLVHEYDSGYDHPFDGTYWGELLDADPNDPADQAETDVIPYTFAQVMRQMRPSDPDYLFEDERPLLRPLLVTFIVNSPDRGFRMYVDDPAADLYRVLLDGCGSLRIRFLLPTEDYHRDGTDFGTVSIYSDDGSSLDWHDYDYNADDADDPTGEERWDFGEWPPDNGDGVLDTEERPIWLDLPYNSSCVPPGYAVPSTDGILCFSPEVRHQWPAALEFTIRLYDRELKVRSQSELDEAVDADGNGFEHGGLTYRFVVPVGG